MTLMGHVLFGIRGLTLLIRIRRSIIAPTRLLVRNGACLLTRSFWTAVLFRHRRGFGHGDPPAPKRRKRHATVLKRGEVGKVHVMRRGHSRCNPGTCFRVISADEIMEANMLNFLKGATVSTIVFLAGPAFAADIAVGRGIICDTQEQMERYVAVFKGNAKDALTTVNTEAKKEDACAAAAVAFLAGETATTARNNDGEAYKVLRILVLGVVTDMGLQQVAPFPQFTIMKIEEISI
jgi:hypothetical protein